MKTKAQLNVLIANWANKPVARVKDSIRPVCEIVAKTTNKGAAQNEAALVTGMLKFADDQSREPTNRLPSLNIGCPEGGSQQAGFDCGAEAGSAGTPQLNSDCSGSLSAAAPSLGPVAGSSSRLDKDAAGPIARDEQKIHRVVVKFEADGALAEQIARAKEVMARHPKGNSLAAIVSEALAVLLSNLDPLEKAARSEASRAKKNQKADKKEVTTTQQATSVDPVSQTATAGAAGEKLPSDDSTAKDSAVMVTLITRYVSAQVRDAVVARAGGQCEYVSKEDRRCCGKKYLELDHILPFALGGESVVENLRVLCASHNRHRAEQTFGVFKKKTASPPTGSVPQYGASVDCASGGRGLTGESS